MFFLNSIYLWALLGLAIPIIIHLWSKKEGKTIKIGSIKLLQESDSEQASSIKFNEFWLLLLRLLAIGVLIMIIAGPRVKRKVNTIPITYIIEPSLLGNDKVNTIIDTLENGISLRLLQTGFPEFQSDQSYDFQITPNYWQLAKEMETIDTDSIIVFTNAFLSGVKGMRPQINKNITWVVFDSEESANTIVKAVKKENKFELFSVLSDNQYLSFQKELVSTDNNKTKLNSTEDSLYFPLNEKQEHLEIKIEENIEILLFYEDSFSNEKIYLEATFKAISRYIDRDIDVRTVQNIDTINFDPFNLVVWLSKDEVIQKAKKTLVFKPDNLANDIIEEGSSKEVFYLTKAINAENIINEHLSEKLLRLLDLHRDIEEKINQYDKRLLETEELLPVDSDLEVRKKNLAILDISKWLWLLLIILLVIERIIAKLRKQ